ncbi:MAG: S-adenosylhomocysteine deaminase [Deltaproteobacteria bacterium]|nr:MAG: S-adenosylhomocysteine deaminase [Deltaproteobacteria bacterium]
MHQPTEIDLILSGRYLVTMDEKRTVVENGAVAIDKGIIVATGNREEMKSRFQAVQELAEPQGVIMPGLINVHTHAAMACFRGLADDLPLMEWLQSHIFPAEANLTGETVYYSTCLSLCEMIKSGTTSFCDMYLFAEDVARAVEGSGMRAWIGEALYDFPSPNYGELENGIAYTRDLLARYKEHDLINITVTPHAVYTCSPELLMRLGQIAADNAALYQIHLSETKDEVNTCMERYKVSPVRHLEQLQLLSERVLAAHCVQVTLEEIELLAEKGVKVAHCVESNMKLASGIAPVVDLLDAGVIVGIGTDGAASNNDVDMFGEMNSVAKLHKVVRMDPTVMDADRTLYAATRGGAAALGVADHVGSLEPGKAADCIVLDFSSPHLVPVYSPVSHLVYAARGSDVLHSVISGKVIMRDRQVLTLDENALVERVQTIIAG